jgi:DNA-binding transcriptional ArsR family regulator
MNEVRRIVETRVLVSRMLSEGMSRGQIAAALSVSKSTVSYHARRLGHPVDERGARRYDWGAVQRFYDDGHSVAECVAHFGFSRQTWSAAVQRGAIATRDWVLPLERLLVADTYRSRHNLKNRLLRAGIKQNRCEECGLAEWRGRPLSMALHHVNGDGRDNRLANLQFLCPNCHSQTENFSGRGRRRAEAA